METATRPICSEQLSVYPQARPVSRVCRRKAKGFGGALLDGTRAHMAKHTAVDPSFMPGRVPPAVYITTCENCDADMAIRADGGEEQGPGAVLCHACYTEQYGYNNRYVLAPPVAAMVRGRAHRIQSTRGHLTARNAARISRMVELVEVV